MRTSSAAEWIRDALEEERPDTAVVPLDRRAVVRGSTTLEALCTTLGPLASLVSAPRGLAITVAGAHVFDRFATTPVARDDVVLAAGIEPRARDLLDLLATVGRAGGAAVVVKGLSVPPPTVLTAAEEAQVALLHARDDVGWGDLFALITACVAPVAAEVASGAFADARDNLDALADATAALAGGAITIEDARMRLLAYSRSDATGDDDRTQGILARSTPEILRRRAGDLLKRTTDATDVIQIAAAGVRPRRAIAVRANGVVLGFVWLAQGTHPLDDQADAALREAARLAAPLMLRERIAAGTERSVRGDLLRRIFDGDALAPMLAAQLGIPRTAWLTVVSYVTSGATALTEPCDEQLGDLIAVQLRLCRDDAVVVRLGAAIYAVLIDRSEPARGPLVSAVRASVARTQRVLGVSLEAGIGTTVAEIGEVPLSRAEASRALRIGAQQELGPIVDVESVRGESFLLALRDFAERTPHAISGQLATLLEHDATRATDYVPTLRAYLDCFGNSGLAAERLHVHANTLRYRIRRIEELAGVDFQAPEQRFVLECQLRLLVRS